MHFRYMFLFQFALINNQPNVFFKLFTLIMFGYILLVFQDVPKNVHVIRYNKIIKVEFSTLVTMKTEGIGKNSTIVKARALP